MNLRKHHYTNERWPLKINIYNTIAYFILLYFNINQIIKCIKWDFQKNKIKCTCIVS